MTADEGPFDVGCLGEALLEVATQQLYRHDVPAVLGISGDALNVAAAAAGAHVGRAPIGVSSGVDGEGFSADRLGDGSSVG